MQSARPGEGRRKPACSHLSHCKKSCMNLYYFLFGLAVGSLSFMAGSARPAAGQSADAEARCTGDVMRLCSEFVPDADAIVVCLNAKKLQLEPSCLNALLPAPPQSLALPAAPRKKVRKVSALPVLTVTAQSPNLRQGHEAYRSQPDLRRRDLRFFLQQ